MSTSASPQKISVRWTFLLLGWGLAAVAWGTYFYLQQQRPTTDDTGFVRFLVAGGVVFSFWLVAVPIVGRLAMRLPITGPAVRRNIAIHFLLAPLAFVVHMGWLSLVAPATFSLLGWDTWSDYWARVSLSGFLFNIRGPVDIVIYWATIFGFEAVENHRRFKERDVEASRLASEIDRLQLDQSKSGRTQQEAITRIPIKSADKSLLIDVVEIDWIEAADSYVIIHVGTKRHLIRESMKWFETNLDSKLFFRAHRQAIVNVARVKEIQVGADSDFILVLSNGSRVPLSRRRRRDFEQLLGRPI